MSDKYNLKTIKKKFQDAGIYHTPEELALFVKSFMPEDIKEVYDPTCGTGELLRVFGDDVVKFGQEISQEQVDIARKELVNCVIACGDTLTSPVMHFDESLTQKKFKAIIANPPFSVSWEQNSDDERFKCLPALPPKSRADYAFIAHILHMLDDDGVAAVLCSPGILYRENAEGKIRRYLVDNKLIDKIVAIPAKKFADTTIQTALIIFKKNKTDSNIEFIDYETNESIIASLEDIKKNDYCLSVNRYIITEEKKEFVDPFLMQEQSRLSFLKAVEHELEVDQMICMLGNFSHCDYIKRIEKVISDHKAKLERRCGQ